MLYEELLELCREWFIHFFRNVSLYENQFTWSAFNEACYDCMYRKNIPGFPTDMESLKRKIPGLRETCGSCRDFFIPQRNESLPRYDLIMGQQHEEVLMEFLSRKLGVRTGRADTVNRSLPDCRVFRPDGKTAAYFEVKFHGAPFVSARRFTGRDCYEGSITLDHKKIEKQLRLIREELDAPAFYVHWLEYPCLKGIFYESSQQVERYIQSQHEVFERKRRAGDDQKSERTVYLKKMYSPLLEMKSFEEFLEELRVLCGISKETAP